MDARIKLLAPQCRECPHRDEASAWCSVTAACVPPMRPACDYGARIIADGRQRLDIGGEDD